MKQFLSVLLAAALLLSLCACSKAPVQDTSAEPPAEADGTISGESSGDQESAPQEPQADAPAIPDGIREENGAARYYQDGAPVSASGLTELSGLTLCFLPDGTLFRFSPGVNDCGGTLYYHTGERGYALLSPAPGLYDSGDALYFVQDDLSLLTGGEDGYLTFGEDGRYSSGSAEIDEGVTQLLTDACAGAEDAEPYARLELAFDYIRDHYKYLSMLHYEAGTDDWAQEAAEAFLRQGKGNCYCFAALFMYCARRLGYQAYVVAGHEARADNDHAWTMIDLDGEARLYDVQLEYAYLYQFDKGETDAFGLTASGGGIYGGFRYFFP